MRCLIAATRCFTTTQLQALVIDEALGGRLGELKKLRLWIVGAWDSFTHPIYSKSKTEVLIMANIAVVGGTDGARLSYHLPL
jgi:hypothetical protein